MKVKCIKLFLGEREVGRACADRFVNMVPPDPFDINSKYWYDDSFFGIETGSADFEERWKLVEANNYFCFSKPTLKLYACEVDE